MNRSRAVLLWLSALFGLVLAASDWPAPSEVWHYRTIHGNAFEYSGTVNTAPFGSPPQLYAITPVTQPFWGEFDLVGLTNSATESRFAISNLTMGSFVSSAVGRLGDGSLTFSAEPIPLLGMEFHVYQGGNSGTLTSSGDVSIRSAPIIECEASHPIVATDRVNIFQTLHLAAAPMRDLWFSTDKPGAYYTNQPSFEAGDILSISGRIVKTGKEIMSSLGIDSPKEGDSGVTAFAFDPTGRILFSAGADPTGDTNIPPGLVWSSKLGHFVQAGAVLSDDGTMVAFNEDLTSAFGLLSPYDSEDLGLTGLQSFDNGWLFFSIACPAFQPSAMSPSQPGAGEILSTNGLIVRDNAQLMSRFHPANGPSNYGLKAFYMWQSGEVWFSVTNGFVDYNLGEIRPGDILSDQGYLAFKNEELVYTFGLTGASSDLGIRGLYIVSEAAPKPAPAQIARLSADPGVDSVTLKWEGFGRAFQVESAPSPNGPFVPAGPISPSRSATINLTNGAISSLYFRLAAW